MAEIQKFGIPLDEETKTTNVVKFGIPLDEDEKKEEEAVTRFGEPLEQKVEETGNADVIIPDGGDIYQSDDDVIVPPIVTEKLDSWLKVPLAKSLGFTEFEKNIRFGLRSGSASFYHTLSNIPGLLLSDDQRKAMEAGMPIENVTNDNQIKLIAGYLYKNLKKVSTDERKRAEKIGKPEGIIPNVYAAGGSAIPVITEYVSGLRALGFINQAYKLPIAFGAVDALRESDKGAKEAGVAFATGATVGKYLDWAGPLAPVSRITSTGALGFSLPADDFGQRVTNAIVFGGTSAIGPMYGNQTIIERTIGETIKKNRNRKFIESFESKVINNNNKALEKTIDEYNVLVKEAKQLQKDKKDTKDIERQLESKSTEMYALSPLLNETKDIAFRVHQEKLDVTTPKQARLQMINFEDSTKAVVPKFKDMSNAEFKKGLSYAGQFFEKYALPPSLGLKRFPIVKYVADKLNIYRINNEQQILKVLDDPQYVDIKKNGTAFKLLKSKPGPNGMFYYFNDLSNKEKTNLINTLFKIEKDIAVLRTKEGEKVPFGINRPLKEVQDELRPFFDKDTLEPNTKGLTEKYKLNETQTLSYLQMREKLKSGLKYFNKTAKEDSNGTVAEIPEIPGYFPHLFLGEYKVFVDKIDAKGVRNLKEIATANTIFGANKLKKEILKRDPDALVNVREVDKGHVGQDMTMSYFAQAISHTKVKGEQSKQLRDIYNDIMADQGLSIFGATRMSRKQEFIDGFAGSRKNRKQITDFETAVSAYIEGLVKTANKIKLNKEVSEFLTTPIVNGPVYTRLTREGFKPDANITISKLYPNQTAYATKLYDVATGALKNPFSKAVAEGASMLMLKSVSPNMIKRAFGGVNQMAAQMFLFTYSARFLIAQGLQPFQMILPKLAYLRDLSGGRFADPYLAILDAQRNLLKPDAFSKKLLRSGQKMTTLNDKFMREFAGQNLYQKQGRKNKGSFPKRLLWMLSGRGIAGRMEIWSRANTLLMFGHLLKRAGVKEQKIIDNAWYLADNYMVRYDAFERPMMYGEGGIGLLGSAAGLFKTFQHNYHAQQLEAIRNAARYGDVSGVAHFYGAQVLVAGAFGVIGIQVADKFIEKLNQSTTVNLPTVSQWLMSIGLPDVAMLGAPSKAIGQDLTATLAAPGLGPGDIFSFPGYEKLSDAAVGAKDIFFKNLLAPLGAKAIDFTITKPIFGDDAPELAPLVIPPTRSELMNAWKLISPNSFNGAIEEYYTNGTVFGIPVPWLEQKEEPTYYEKGTARLKREFYDWFSRYFSAYSIKEAKILKLTFQLQQIRKSRQLTYGTLMDFAVSTVNNLPPDAALPQWIFNLGRDMGYSDEQMFKSIKTRMKNRDRTLLDSVLKGDLFGPSRKLKQKDLDLILKNLTLDDFGDEMLVPEDIKDEELY